ncbi:MAG: hypothetical protein ACJ76S_00910 [Solirubrobacteraceae bacterium]
MPSGPASIIATVIAMRWLVWWAFLGALWLAVDDTVALPELIDGAVAAALGATVAEIVHAQRVVRARPRARWLLGAWRLPLATARDVCLLLATLISALLRPGSVHGEFRAVDFRAGADDDPRDTARRALAKGAGSFAPNTYVVGIDRARDSMLVHQLRASRRARDPDPLELR